MEVISISRRQRAFTVESSTPLDSPALPADGVDLRMMLPSNAMLYGVSIAPGNNVPRTVTRVSLRNVSHPHRNLNIIPQGLIWQSVGTSHGAYWHGGIPLSEDFEYEIVARIYHMSGSTVIFGMTAWMKDGVD